MTKNNSNLFPLFFICVLLVTIFITFNAVISSADDGVKCKQEDVDKLVLEKEKKCGCKTDEENDSIKELARIQCWISCIERDPRDYEKELSTFTFVSSAINIKTMEKANYYEMLRVQRKKYEEVGFRISKFINVYDKKKLKQIAAQVKIHQELSNASSVNTIQSYFKRLRASDEHLDKDMISAVETAMILDSIYPGFVGNLLKDPSSELKELKKTYKSQCSGDETNICDSLQGEINGLTWIIDKAKISGRDFGFNGESSAGNGVYMCENVSNFVQHFEGAGLICNAEGIKVIDIAESNYDPAKLDKPEDQQSPYVCNLEGKANLVLFKKAGLVANVPVYKNLLNNPALFEKASENRILRFQSGMGVANVNKFAIDMNNNCRYIEMKDFNTCYDFDKLIFNLKDGMLVMLTKFNNKPGMDKFIEMTGKCGGAKKCEKVKSIFSKIGRSDLNHLVREYNTEVTDLLKGCSFKVEKNESGDNKVVFE